MADDLELIIKRIKKEERTKHATRIGMHIEEIQYTLRSLNWAYDRPGIGWLTTAIIIKGLREIRKVCSIEEVYTLMKEIMISDDYYAHRCAMTDSGGGGGSAAANSYLTEQEHGRIGMLSEILGFSTPKTIGYLFAFGVFDNVNITDSESKVYTFAVDKFKGTLTYRAMILNSINNFSKKSVESEHEKGGEF